MKNRLLTAIFALSALGAFAQQGNIDDVSKAGQLGDQIGKMDAAIKADPRNKALYYQEGLIYAQAGESAGNTIKQLQMGAQSGAKPDPQVARLQQARDAFFEKAAASYYKALTIDPDYFEAMRNLGHVLMAPAIALSHEAQQLPANQQKAYDVVMKKAKAQYEMAKPYLLKAAEQNPNSLDALTNLKSYYLGTQDVAGVRAIQKRIDALPKK